MNYRVQHVADQGAQKVRTCGLAWRFVWAGDTVGCLNVPYFGVYFIWKFQTEERVVAGHRYELVRGADEG